MNASPLQKTVDLMIASPWVSGNCFNAIATSSAQPNTHHVHSSASSVLTVSLKRSLDSMEIARHHIQHFINSDLASRMPR